MDRLRTLWGRTGHLAGVVVIAPVVARLGLVVVLIERGLVTLASTTTQGTGQRRLPAVGPRAASQGGGGDCVSPARGAGPVSRVGVPALRPAARMGGEDK